jgi:hypothetical protein
MLSQMPKNVHFLERAEALQIMTYSPVLTNAQTNTTRENGKFFTLEPKFALSLHSKSMFM